MRREPLMLFCYCPLSRRYCPRDGQSSVLICADAFDCSEMASRRFPFVLFLQPGDAQGRLAPPFVDLKLSESPIHIKDEKP